MGINDVINKMSINNTHADLFYFPVHRSKTFSHRSGEARPDYEDFPPTRRAFPLEI
jgi:hypothetical protein